jgi:hypothetical protein
MHVLNSDLENGMKINPDETLLSTFQAPSDSLQSLGIETSQWPPLCVVDPDLLSRLLLCNSSDLSCLIPPSLLPRLSRPVRSS